MVIEDETNKLEEEQLDGTSDQSVEAGKQGGEAQPDGGDETGSKQIATKEVYLTNDESLQKRLLQDESVPLTVKEKILGDVERGMNLWHGMANWLVRGLIVLGSIAVFCSLYITAFAGSCALSTLGIRILSFISALCLTCITAFNLNGKQRGVRKGWRHMKDAVFKYQARQISLSDLIKASNEAEEMLGYADFQSDGAKVSFTNPTTKQGV